jgi:hypothetical protein
MKALNLIGDIFSTVATTGCVWSYVTLYKMLVQVNKRLSTADQIGTFWLGYEILKVRRLYKSFYPSSSLLKSNSIASALTVFGLVGSLVAFIPLTLSSNR